MDDVTAFTTLTVASRCSLVITLEQHINVNTHAEQKACVTLSTSFRSRYLNGSGNMLPPRANPRTLLPSGFVGLLRVLFVLNLPAYGPGIIFTHPMGLSQILPGTSTETHLGPKRTCLVGCPTFKFYIVLISPVGTVWYLIASSA